MENSNNNFFKNHNLSDLLFGAVLSWIVAVILQPILEFLLDKGYQFLGFLSDKIYQAISTGGDGLVSLAVFYLLYMMCTVKLTDLFTSHQTVYKELLSALSQRELELHSLSYEFYGTTMPSNTPSDKEISQKFEQTQEKISLRKREAKRNHVILTTLLVTLYIVFLLYYASVLFIHNKATMLTNNIEIVAPYVSDIEYKTLKSNFHSIQNQGDFNRLANELSRIANEHSLSLKK